MKRVMRIIFWTVMVTWCSCQSRSRSGLVDDNLFAKGIGKGTVDKQLVEASGLVASHINTGMLWSHNDSGHPPEIFLIDSSGAIKMKCTLKGARNRDWEDIAIATDSATGKSYLYIGDIGDNLSKFESKFIYRVEEPAFDTVAKVITRFDTIELKLPDGKRDTEALTIDPLTNEIVLISKREDAVHVYTSPADETGQHEMKKIAEIPFSNIVAADFSADGTELLLKDYDKIFYWRRFSGETLAGLLSRIPSQIPYKREPQGESICFSGNGDGFYTLSEGSNSDRATLFYYRRMAPTVSQ